MSDQDNQVNQVNQTFSKVDQVNRVNQADQQMVKEVNLTPEQQGVVGQAETKCGKCHILVRPTDYFCFNCGAELKVKPEPVSWTNQLALYLGSLLLPPLGIVWGFRYLRKPHPQAKVVGVVAIVLTVLVLILAVGVGINMANRINDQVLQQVQQLQSF